LGKRRERSFAESKSTSEITARIIARSMGEGDDGEPHVLEKFAMPRRTSHINRRVWLGRKEKGLI